MSKDRKKLLHIHSSVNDKQPTPATLELGELGVNNAKGNAFISTKNSDGEVVRFSEDETIIKWMEQKEVFPYEGYMRGADNSQVDGVTEQDLLDNKSNLIIKLNQVVPENTDYTPYDEKVNGAKDIYGNLINPISSGDYKDGAGLAIDMSNYAMIGANPSFSSITTTCHATLNGTTEIKGKGDGCGSKFTVEVANACIDATDTLNEYGVNHSNFGTSCDGTKISNDTTLKGKKIFIDSPSGDLTVDIQACNHISGRTNDFVIRECQDNGGKVEIDTTDIDVSASTTDIESCDRISAITNDFQVKECSPNGSAGISSTTINNSASTIDERACIHINEETNSFNVTECEDGSGTTKIKSCKGISALTNNFVVKQCGDSGTTNIESCKEFKVNSNSIVLEQCTSGTTTIHSCDGIKLESKNIVLTDGDCGSGQTTIEVDDLCLVGESKVNVYGDKTNVGLDCDDITVATNTNIYGKDILVSATTGTINEIAINGNINESAITITNTASNNICDQANNEATFYGANLTRIGITCDGTLKSNKIEISGEDVCVDADDRASVYGANKSDLGINCADDDRSTLTRVSGDTVNVGGNDITVYAEDLLCESGNTVTIFAGEGGKLTIGGDACDGNTNGTYPITYVRRPKTGVCDIHSLTIDDALDEVYDRSRIYLTSTAHTDSSTGSNYSYTEYTLHQDSGTCDVAIPFTVKETIVAMSAETYSPESELLKKYTLWQYIGGERKEIGEINIPKDHLIEDVRIVYGTVVDDPTSGGQTFITCSTQSQNCHWYIEMKWYVWDGSHTDKWTYLPADDFVKDIDENNSNTDRGVNVDVWYNPISGRNEVSADTTIYFTTPSDNNDFAYKKADGKHYESGTTIIFKSGDVKDFSEKKYKPWSASTEINIPTEVSHLNRGKFTVKHCDQEVTFDPSGDTSITMSHSSLSYTHNGFTGTYNPCSGGTFTAPHSSLTINYGSTCNNPEAVDKTYDTSADEKIVIPKTIDDITGGAIKLNQCSGDCLTINADICMSGHTIVAKGFYSKSDIRLKNNIQTLCTKDYEKIDKIDFKSFYFSDDETKTKTYGVIAQDAKSAGLNDIVHSDENGYLNVDYISLLILKVANLENKLKALTEKMEELKNEQQDNKG